MAVESKRIAFFDVDNTMLRGSTLFLLVRGLYHRGFFRPRELAKWAIAQTRFRLSGKERLTELDRIRERALGFIKGHRVDELRAIAEEIYDERIREALWDGTLKLVSEHLQAGDEVWLVTATPVEVAEVMVEHLGLTGAIGTTAEKSEGYYTGRLVGDLLHGPAKAIAVRKLVEERGAKLSDCIAYSDSSNDLPMLYLVGEPHVINPDSKLKSVAKKSQWPVHDFRHGRKVIRVLTPLLTIAGIFFASRKKKD